MSKKIAVTLELTKFEAEVLALLTMAGVMWGQSGEMGDAARDISDALFRAGVREAKYKVASSDGWPEHRSWSKI
jgi:hypothetical protein